MLNFAHPPRGGIPPRKEPMKRFPSLDGLRAISIALVLLNHVAGARYFLPASVLAPLGDLGNFGVRIFFVISGFLITSLLLAELAKTNRVSLKKFYIRRALRIFPAFYAFILALVIAWRVGWLPLRLGDLIHAVTYTMNYRLTDTWSLRHLWSLSVEEQFYLLWPAVLLLVKPRRAVWVIAAVLIAVPVDRVLLFWLVPGYSPYINMTFETVCDALATGCLLALLRPALGRIRGYRAILTSKAFPTLFAVALLANKLGTHPRAYYLAGIPAMNMIVAMSIDRDLSFPGLPIGRILNSRPMELIGSLSYSIYLWQQPFLIQGRPPASLLNVFPGNVVAVMACAALSHWLIERPFLRLKAKFASG